MGTYNPNYKSTGGGLTGTDICGAISTPNLQVRVLKPTEVLNPASRSSRRRCLGSGFRAYEAGFILLLLVSVYKVPL